VYVSSLEEFQGNFYVKALACDVTREVQVGKGREKAHFIYRDHFMVPGRPIFLLDSPGTILDANGSACELLQLPLEASAGMAFTEVLKQQGFTWNPQVFVPEEAAFTRQWVYITSLADKKSFKASFLQVGQQATVVQLEQLEVPGVNGEPLQPVQPHTQELASNAALTNLHMLVRMLDVSGKNYFFSETWSQYTGMSTNDLVSGGFQQLVHPDDFAAIHRIGPAISRRQSFSLIYRLLLSNGQTLAIQEHGFPYFNPLGNFEGFIVQGALQLEKPQKQAIQLHVQATMQAEESLKDALENAMLLALTLDEAGTVRHCNHFFYDVTGWKPQEIIGRSFLKIFEPSLENNGEPGADGFLQAFEGVLLTKNMVHLMVRFNAIPLKNHQGQVSSITLLGEDITEQIKMTRALHESNELLQDLFDSANDLIFIFNEHGKFLFVNNTWNEKMGYTTREMVYINFEELVEDDSLETVKGYIKKAREQGKVDDFMGVFTAKDHRRVYLAGSLSCTEAVGKPTLFRAILFDNTERLRAEKAQNLYFQVAKLVEKGIPIQDLYHQFYRLLNEVLDVDCFMVALKNGPKKEVTFPFYINPPNVVTTEDIIFRDFASYAAGRFERPIFLSEEWVLKIAENEGILIRSQVPKVWIGVPLIVNEKSVGMIIAASYQQSKAHHKRDLELLSFVSGQLADAILRHEHEMEISSQAARLKAIFESGTHLMWSVDASFRLSNYNRNFADAIWEYFHFAPSLKTPLFRIFSRQDKKFLRLWYEKYRNAFQGMPQQFEMKFLTENGEEHWREIFLNPITDKHQHIKEVSGVAHDITQKKVSELGLAESEEKFRNIFESFQDVYFRIDLEGIITMISPSIYELVGESQIEVLGRSITHYLISHVNLQQLLKTLIKKGNVRNFESQIRTRDGELKNTFSNFRMIFGPNNEPVAVEGVARDITNLKKATEELRVAKEIAEKSLEVKKRFLSNMSHEIRTPMNGIIGMIDLLMESPLNVEQREFVTTIKKSSETLLTILNDILDLSKIEAGKMELRLVPVSIQQLIDKLYALFLQQAQVKGTRMYYEIAPEVHDAIEADETRLLQILSNLTSNAIKFTENGEIYIRVALLSSTPEDQEIRFEVEDNGIGISDKNLDLLFKQFSQVDNSYTKSYGGTGLGLAISQELCKLMGGAISVASELGKGSKFWFTIRAYKADPTQVVLQQVAEEEVEAFDEPPKVLVVDDNMVNLSVAGRILKKAGCDLSFSLSGIDAIKMVMAQHFDVVFMDIQMPVMNGITATKKIKELPIATIPPVVAMTAFTLNEERAEFLEAGLDDFISKPIKAKALVAKVRKWYKGRENGQPQRPVEYPIVKLETAEELKKYGGNDLLKDSYGEFETDTLRLLNECWVAMLHDQVKDALSCLHTIKGNAGTLGVEKVYRQAAFMEGRLKSNDKSNFKDHFQALKDYHEEFTKYYKHILGLVY
jgi:PAS domain S-box-containing protein